MMTKDQLRAELFRVKNAIGDALIDAAENGGSKADLYSAILAIWRDMNSQDYK
jgi:hypothetical protein